MKHQEGGHFGVIQSILNHNFNREEKSEMIPSSTGAPVSNMKNKQYQYMIIIREGAMGKPPTPPSD